MINTHEKIKQIYKVCENDLQEVVKGKDIAKGTKEDVYKFLAYLAQVQSKLENKKLCKGVCFEPKDL